MKQFNCTKLKAARDLVRHIKVDIPVGFAPEADGHSQTVAEIKSQYSNYEQLVRNLPACPCPGHEERPYDCPNRANAADTLRWAANGLAELAYQEWLAKQK